jgi:hypothetical protein
MDMKLMGVPPVFARRFGIDRKPNLNDTAFEQVAKEDHAGAPSIPDFCAESFEVDQRVFHLGMPVEAPLFRVRVLEPCGDFRSQDGEFFDVAPIGKIACRRVALGWRGAGIVAWHVRVFESHTYRNLK